MVVWQAQRERIENFSVLVAHVLVPPALEAILSSSSCKVQAFLAPGHVCAVEGIEDYLELCQRYSVPIVVTGFEPVDILEGTLMSVRQLEEGRSEVENQYARAVAPGGNRAALQVVREVFEVSDRAWRGIGVIPRSGLRLRTAYESFDALNRFPRSCEEAHESELCRSGLVLQGIIKPVECTAFGSACSPARPLGAPMVSSEGACAAYYLYGRRT
jgi:hydrogenase expression/formation protein HypD